MYATGHNQSYYPVKKKKNQRKSQHFLTENEKRPQISFEYDNGCKESNSFQHFYYNQRH